MKDDIEAMRAALLEQAYALDQYRERLTSAREFCDQMKKIAEIEYEHTLQDCAENDKNAEDILQQAYNKVGWRYGSVP